MSTPERRRQLLLVYALVLTYSLCFMAQQPLMPYLTAKLGADNRAYGMLQSSFSALQLVGGLLSGPLVDRYGGKALLLVSLVASTACYILTAMADSMWMLYVSKIPSLMQHAMLAARTMVTAQSGGEDRAAALGYLGLAYGVGFGLGPALGGQLSTLGLQATAWAAAAGSLLAAVLAALLLEPDRPRGSAARAAAAATAPSEPSGASRGKGGDLAALRVVLRQPGVPALLSVKLLAGAAFAIFQSTFLLVLRERYGQGSRQSGITMSYVGGLAVLAQGGLVKPATAYLGEDGAVVLSCAAMAAAFLAIGAAPALWQFLGALAPLVCAATLMSTVNTAQLTKAVPSSMSGAILSIDMSTGSALRMLSPVLGTYLMAQLGYAGMCGVSTALMLVLLGGLWALRLAGGAGVAASAGDNKPEAKTQ